MRYNYGCGHAIIINVFNNYYSPNLTWRDIQYLLIYTANSDVLMTVDNTALWFTNGAGLTVSPQFGFGVIDAEAMVTRSTDWVTVPEQMITNVTPTHSSGLVQILKYF